MPKQRKEIKVALEPGAVSRTKRQDHRNDPKAGDRNQNNYVTLAVSGSPNQRKESNWL